MLNHASASNLVSPSMESKCLAEALATQGIVGDGDEFEGHLFHLLLLTHPLCFLWLDDWLILDTQRRWCQASITCPATRMYYVWHLQKVQFICWIQWAIAGKWDPSPEWQHQCWPTTIHIYILYLFFCAKRLAVHSRTTANTYSLSSHA